jgi:hypothetical protein
MRAYRSGEVARHADVAENFLKHLVQRAEIRPDVHATEGTGDPNRFGFLDTMEAAVAGRLNGIPGRMPLASTAVALDAMRLEAALPDTPWRRFMDPTTRDARDRFWLVRFADGAWEILDAPGIAAAIKDGTGALLVLRIDTLLLDLERKTGDYVSVEELDRVWTKETRPTGHQDASVTADGRLAVFDEGRDDALEVRRP